MTDTRTAGQQGAVTAAPTAEELAEALRAALAWKGTAEFILSVRALNDIYATCIMEHGTDALDATAILARYDTAKGGDA